MDEFVFGITLKIRSQKKGMTKTQANDFVGILVVKLHDLVQPKMSPSISLSGK